MVTALLLRGGSGCPVDSQMAGIFSGISNVGRRPSTVPSSTSRCGARAPCLMRDLADRGTATSTFSVWRLAHRRRPAPAAGSRSDAKGGVGALSHIWTERIYPGSGGIWRDLAQSGGHFRAVATAENPLHHQAFCIILSLRRVVSMRLPVPASDLSESAATAGGAAAATWPHPRLQSQDANMVDPLFNALLRILKAAFTRLMAFRSKVLLPARFGAGATSR